MPINESLGQMSRFLGLDTLRIILGDQIHRRPENRKNRVEDHVAEERQNDFPNEKTGLKSHRSSIDASLFGIGVSHIFASISFSKRKVDK
jgi:hypothetical protein